MGMDLSANSETCGGFHVNWTGWGMLVSLLEQLGCDVSEAAVTNDGFPISASSTLEWATALKSSFADIGLGTIPDEHFEGGHREMFVLHDGNPLDDDDRNWLNTFIDFLENCDGCEQW